MEEKEAVEYFYGKEKYNCAQAILIAFNENCGIDKEKIKKTVEEYRSLGGGHAEGGQCGALYAGKELINDPEKAKMYEKEFLKEIGSVNCREIKKDKKVPCKVCVQVASDLLKKAINCFDLKRSNIINNGESQ